MGGDLVRRLREHFGITEKIESAASPKIAQYRYNPEVFKYVAETMVAEAGVEILYHTMVVETICDDEESVAGLVIENKSGRAVVLGKMVVDGTGDGDIAEKAGAWYEIGDENGVTQSMTTMFRIINADAEKAKGINLKELRAKLIKERERKLYKLERVDGVMAATVPFYC